jgi:hypothetical protein
MKVKFVEEPCCLTFEEQHEGEVVLYNDDYLGIHLGNCFYSAYAPGFTDEYRRRAKLKEQAAFQEEQSQSPMFELEAAPAPLDSSVLARLLEQATVEGVVLLRKEGLI